MLLIMVTINNMTKRISNEALNLEHRWHPYVDSFTSPTYSTAYEYGGFARFDFGSITISPAMFVEEDYTDGGIYADQSPYNWPPPVTGKIIVGYTTTTEAAAIVLFETDLHLNSYNNESVTYDIRDKEYGKKLLPTASAYAEPYEFPRAFGRVALVPLKRMYDGNGYILYSLGDLLMDGVVSWHIIGGIYTTTNGTLIYTGYSNGQSVAHDFAVGDVVHFDGIAWGLAGANWIVGEPYVSQPDWVVRISNMSADQFESLRDNWVPNATIYKNGEINVFDRDDNLNDTMTYFDATGYSGIPFDWIRLTSQPVGLISATGTASLTTVDEIMEWATGELGISSYNNDKARIPSPRVYKWADQQQLLIDFCSDMCACNTHFFYIADDTLYLVDLYQDNGTLDLTEFEFFEKVEYSTRPPIKRLLWNQQMVNAIKDDDPRRYSYLNNRTEGYPYGTDIEITMFHDQDIATVMYSATAAGIDAEAAIDMIKGVLKKQKATIKIPFGATLVYPGVRIAWVDGSVPIDTPCYIRARTIEYDFVNYEIIITGEGEMLRPGQMGVIASG